jgi:orotate phosphoribosyltransferase
MSSEIAEAMVAIGAVGFRLNDPVTFKSGIKSPVYCDNRKFPFWPEQWQKVIRGFAGLVHEKGILCDVVGGIEAAGIPHSAALGFAMSKPSIFIRKEAKAHGAMKRVEGGDVAGKNVVLIEDLVTTGGSSLSAVWALRDEGAVVKDCLCIISYGFLEAQESFARAGVRLHALTNFDAVLVVALRRKMIDEAGAALVRAWMRDPRGWKAIEKRAENNE